MEMRHPDRGESLFRHLAVLKHLPGSPPKGHDDREKKKKSAATVLPVMGVLGLHVCTVTTRCVNREECQISNTSRWAFLCLSLAKKYLAPWSTTSPSTGGLGQGGWEKRGSPTGAVWAEACLPPALHGVNPTGASWGGFQFRGTILSSLF